MDETSARKEIQILIVDDEPGMTRLLSDILTDAGYTARPHNNPVEAVEAFRVAPADLVLTDIKMPGMDGIEFFRRIRERDPRVPVIVITGYATAEIAIDALKLGAMNFVRKPFDVEEIVTVVGKAVRAAKLVWRKRGSLERLAPRTALEIDSDLELIPPSVECLLETAAASRTLTRAEEIDCAAALSEGIANAMRHGNKLDPAKKVRIWVEVEGDTVLFRIRDEGDGFDLSSVPDPTTPEALLRPCGRGIFLMRHYMDEVRYLADGSVLELVKRLGRERERS